MPGTSPRPAAISPPVLGTLRPLIVLIDFQDHPSTLPPSAFVPLFFGSGASDNSVANYWSEVSYGNFAVNGTSGDIIGWVRPSAAPSLPGEFLSTVTTYAQITDPVAGVNIANLRQLIADLVLFLDPTIDFSLYADAATGVVESLILVHAGTGQEDTGSPADLYSHTAGAGPIVTGDPLGANPVRVIDYMAVPELLSFDPPTGAAVPTRIGAGVVVHEMGHLMGLPDLYPTGSFGSTGADFSGAGVFDLMAYGMWGSNLVARPDVPSHLSAWSKMVLGWATPALVTASTSRTLQPAELFPEIDKIYSNTSADPGQFFLVENREAGSTLGNFLFDRFLPGSGILVWQIDDEVIQANLSSNTVNTDNVSRGVYVKEADGIPDTGLPIAGQTADERARFFGQPVDFFSLPGQLFSRTSPSAQVNSSPVFDNVLHPFDFDEQVEMLLFTRTADNSVDYVINIAGAGGGGPSWKTFNINSTQPPRYPAPMRSNDILSIAFDSGNNVWMGSRDEGIFRFLGTSFEFLTGQRGLPSGSGTPVVPIHSMAFETATGSMWVGTEQGLFKMRDSGSGFRVLSSFTTVSPVPRTLPGSNVVRALAVRNGTDIKYAGSPAGLVRIVDGRSDGEADDFAGLVFAGDVTSIAIDDNGNANISDDVVWVGTAGGSLYRSLLSSEGGPADNDPILPAHFKTYTLAGGPGITSLSVDKLGRLWIGTDSMGVQVFDLGETLVPPQADLRDPFDFDLDGDRVAEAYLNTTRGIASNHLTGISFQATGDPEVIAWAGHVRDLNNAEGGASRFDANAPNDNVTVIDERVTVFRPEAGVLPENQVNGPSSTWIRATAGDSAGNVWFGTTAIDPQGVSRFGNAGVISLDKSNYVNVSAVATITLQDDGRNVDSGIADLAIVRVTSASDGTGFPMTLAETGPDTGIFRGTFGFSNGASDGSAAPPVIRVQNGDLVTVSYADANPPGLRTATATWKMVFPFEDSLLIEGGACFIATAAYGSILAPEVRSLRAFRDAYLMTHAPGKALVAVYYRFSPPLAAIIGEDPSLRAATRFFLAPAAMFASFARHAGPGEAIATGAVALGIPWILWWVPVRSGRRGKERENP